MATSPKAQPAISSEQEGAAHVQGSPFSPRRFSHEIAARMLPPLLAVVSVLTIWLALYLVFPRLLPGPVSTFGEALRLLEEGTFFFHMLQSLRRVFVGSTISD